jgi:phage tail-like protein
MTLANVGRLDPYKSFNFKVKWDGQYVAAVSKISALKRSTEVIKHREGGDQNRTEKLPGMTVFEPIILERGIVADNAFEEWANKVLEIGRSGRGADFRKDIVIDVLDDTGKRVLSYKVFRCWVSEYQALPDLNASGNVVGIEHIRLENEGWERDHSVEDAQ